MPTSKSKIRVVIADDHLIFIEGIKTLIKDTDVALVGEATDGDNLIQILQGKDADVVLMDVNMPRLNGIQATEKIKSRFPNVKVLGLTMVEDSRNISAMMKAGASGYLLKTTGKQELIDAIHKVHEGQRYLSNEVSLKLIDDLLTPSESSQTSRQERNPQITRRESEIIKLIAQELTNDEIARKLNNSPMTIITHRKNLLRKLGVKNTAGLVKYAVQNGLVD